MGEGDLDAFVERIARGLFAPPRGIQIRQRRLAPQIAFPPKRESLRHHDRMPAEDIRVAIILIAVRNRWIVKRIRARGLGRGGQCIERGRAQRRVELAASREHAFDRRAQGRELRPPPQI